VRTISLVDRTSCNGLGAERAALQFLDVHRTRIHCLTAAVVYIDVAGARVALQAAVRIERFVVAFISLAIAVRSAVTALIPRYSAARAAVEGNGG
jgi:hypothetical protein